MNETFTQTSKQVVGQQQCFEAGAHHRQLAQTHLPRLASRLLGSSSILRRGHITGSWLRHIYLD